MSNSNSNPSWSPASWKSKPIKQHVQYEEESTFNKSISKLEKLPPLVTPYEIENLKTQLQEVCEKKAFLLQGGDCAELFDDCLPSSIENRLKVLIQMSLVLVWGGKIPVVRIARMAGQYAKPRSSNTELIDGVEYSSFRGDNINGFELDQRKPDPTRLVEAYFHSATTLNYTRSLLSSGFADLTHYQNWDLSHVRCSKARDEFQAIVDQLKDTLDFMKTIKSISSDGTAPASMRTVELFMSHESLMLDYESALTRQLKDPKTGELKWYNVSTHYLWVGDRTRQLDGAHVEYLSGVANPIGIKVGPTFEPSELLQLLDKLNPKREVGRITLITRFGNDKISQYLETFIRVLKNSDHPVVWVCDPMHGNTEMSSSGVKTRNFDNIMGEVTKAFQIHQACGSQLNGVHFELTGESVTECLGGSMELEHHHLRDNYQTACDPRLNYEQSLDMAFLIAKYYCKERSESPTL